MLDTLIFNNGDYEVTVNNELREQGIYRIDGQKITLTKTHGKNWENNKFEKTSSIPFSGEITGENTFVFHGTNYTRR